MSAGVYGWAAGEVARIAVETVRAETSEEDSIGLVRFVLFSDALLAAFEAALAT